jgi:hypothetical protein
MAALQIGVTPSKKEMDEGVTPMKGRSVPVWNDATHALLGRYLEAMPTAEIPDEDQEQRS